ncbi:GFA family protein [Haliangium sp.]|uniref:GFA family protein n=1 Tax=Haliangium sp. TaxID=2663208 RepID=UPI003D0F974E
MSDAKTYTGSCHCGNVRFHVTAALDKAITCNCSMCSRAGYVLSFVPPEAFTLDQGEDSLSDYQFGAKNIHHLFCSNCGVRSFGRGAGPDGTEMVAINLRCLDDLDLASVPTAEFDGKSL